uniref:CSN8/PSMD8/EIF3K domain-containing protein n=1 Tax=Bos mutus grunniens TaxID=30521 RepID=A0A8B9XY21_BOSMU
MTQRNQRGACAGALGGAVGFYVIAGATPRGTEWGLVLLRRRGGGPAWKMPVAVMAESSFSFKKLLDQCENQELEAPGGIATPPVYGQLLALYLLHNDMNNARYLWKRIPPAIKSANSELGESGQLASGSGRGTSPGSTAPSTPISGLRPSSQSWKLSEVSSSKAGKPTPPQGWSCPRSQLQGPWMFPSTGLFPYQSPPLFHPSPTSSS